MNNEVEQAKTIVVEAIRYLFYKDNEDFTEAYENYEFIRQFIKEIDDCTSIAEVKNILKINEVNDLTEVLKSKEFSQLLKKMNCDNSGFNILNELTKTP